MTFRDLPMYSKNMASSSQVVFTLRTKTILKQLVRILVDVMNPTIELLMNFLGVCNDMPIEESTELVGMPVECEEEVITNFEWLQSIEDVEEFAGKIHEIVIVKDDLESITEYLRLPHFVRLRENGGNQDEE